MNSNKDKVKDNLPWITISDKYDAETGEILTYNQVKQYKKNKEYEQVKCEIKYYSERGVNVKHVSRGYGRKQLNIFE